MTEIARTVLIVGSARKDGDTERLAQHIHAESSWPIIDLNGYRIEHYDYEHLNKDDDFLPLMRRTLTLYDTFVFATPVYWYAMSGVMKVFFDRLTDLLTIEKELGRQLRGKRMAAISCSNGNNLGDAFWLPFRETAHYLGMAYVGNLHTVANTSNTENLKQFLKKIEDGGH